MKLLTAEQIRNWDQFTIINEPIRSIDLMERAASVFSDWFVSRYEDTERPVYVFCGSGNNGGDGLAVARMLNNQFFNVEVYLVSKNKRTSEDFDINLKRWTKKCDKPVFNTEDGFPDLPKNSIVIDAIFGTGINKPVTGEVAEVIESINNSHVEVVSIDMPSGLPAEGICTWTAIKSSIVLTFQIPKLSLFLKDNYAFCKEWVVEDIGLSLDFDGLKESRITLLELSVISPLLIERPRYSHKGSYGHAIIIAGSSGKMGAAVLATRACIRSGAGLVTAAVPKSGRDIMQISIPEAMVEVVGQDEIENLPIWNEKHTLGLGPGLGTHEKTIDFIDQLLDKVTEPLVIDADALNILSMNKQWLERLPANSILTPHPKEFERLFDSSDDELETIKLAQEMSVKLGVIIILKGAWTRIFTPDGHTYINSTGHPGMATGGSGDVLTGILTSLLAQGYSPVHAAIFGVFIHGLAGDIALKDQSYESMKAGDIIDNLGQAFVKIRLFQYYDGDLY